MIVVDASVLAPALGDDGVSGERARSRLISEDLTAPEIIDLEVMSTLRGLALAGTMSARWAGMALRDLDALPFERVSHRHLLSRCWELRANLTAYDAAYVALAELIDAPLITADARISRAPGLRCAVEVLTA